jgi:histidyl-tRNA synthetase
MDVIYEIDDALVRGLDYYGHTVFEIEANIKGFGAQNILGGGGHYEKLVSEFGGPDVSGVGIAFGMERLMQAIEAENVEMPKDKPFDFYVLYFDEATKLAALTILSELRDLGYKGDIDHLDRKFATQLKSALKNNPNYLIIIGEEELNSNLYTLKNVKTEEQKTVDFDELVKKLGKKR